MYCIYRECQELGPSGAAHWNSAPTLPSFGGSEHRLKRCRLLRLLYHMGILHVYVRSVIFWQNLQNILMCYRKKCSIIVVNTAIAYSSMQIRRPGLASTISVV